MNLPKTTTVCIEEGLYTVTNDPFNKRIRVDDYYGNINRIVRTMEKIAADEQYGKIIIKARQEDVVLFLSIGYVLEAIVDHYFSGNNMYFLCKFLQSERRNSDVWHEEDELLENILSSKLIDSKQSSHEYSLVKCTENDAEQLADLYKTVFKVYPVPMNNPMYIKKCMREGSVFLAYEHDGKMISAVSAEVNQKYRNAEITDCATLPDYRKFKLMQFLIARLEDELRSRRIYCLYSIARANSYGMNAVFHRLHYMYRGRLANNCYIFEDIEDMNVWVKFLTR